MKPTPELITEGQSVFVTRYETFFDNKPNLTEYKVVQANKSSFYVCPINTDMRYPYRFSQKTRTYRENGSQMTAYPTKEEYWDIINNKEEIQRLTKEIKQYVDNMDLLKLRQTHAFTKKIKRFKNNETSPIKIW